MPPLYRLAKTYIEIIEKMEQTSDKKRLLALEEKRIIRHNKLFEALKTEGIPFRDREDVTRIAYRLARDPDEA